MSDVVPDRVMWRMRTMLRLTEQSGASSSGTAPRRVPQRLLESFVAAPFRERWCRCAFRSSRDDAPQRPIEG
eukprot:360517-Chlamydomonas_euryale.AAC.4